MKSLKWLLLLAALGAAAVKFTPAGRYARVAGDEVIEWADKQIPFETKLKAFRNDIADVDKVIDKQKHEVAKRAASAARAKEAHAGCEAALGDTRKRLRDAKFALNTCSTGELNDARAAFVAASKKFEAAEASAAEAASAAARAAALHRTAMELLAKKQEARDVIAKEVDALEAQHAALQLSAAKNGRGDDEFAKLKERIAKLRGELDVEKRVVEMDPPRPAQQSVAGTEFEKPLKKYAARANE
jgi:chromosome segregation ATPase